MTAFNILSKAIRSLATESGFEVEIKDGFVALKDTNFGIAWISGYDFEVITNYSRSASWEHLKENPVSGDYRACTLAAIRKAQYWKSKTA